jgi:hypothetical protein
MSFLSDFKLNKYSTNAIPNSHLLFKGICYVCGKAARLFSYLLATILSHVTMMQSSRLTYCIKHISPIRNYGGHHLKAWWSPLCPNGNLTKQEWSSGKKTNKVKNTRVPRLTGAQENCEVHATPKKNIWMVCSAPNIRCMLRHWPARWFGTIVKFTIIDAEPLASSGFTS